MYHHSVHAGVARVGGEIQEAFWRKYIKTFLLLYFLVHTTGQVDGGEAKRQNKKLNSGSQYVVKRYKPSAADIEKSRPWQAPGGLRLKMKREERPLTECQSVGHGFLCDLAKLRTLKWDQALTAEHDTAQSLPKCGLQPSGCWMRSTEFADLPLSSLGRSFLNGAVDAALAAQTNVFVPDGTCRYTFYTCSTLAKALGTVWIHFSGDSVLRGVFCTIQNLCQAPGQAKIFRNACGSRGVRAPTHDAAGEWYGFQTSEGLVFTFTYTMGIIYKSEMLAASIRQALKGTVLRKLGTTKASSLRPRLNAVIFNGLAWDDRMAQHVNSPEARAKHLQLLVKGTGITNPANIPMVYFGGHCNVR